MSNQIRQKKKKEALRRLSQSRGSHHGLSRPFRGVGDNTGQNTMKRGFHSTQTNQRYKQDHHKFLDRLGHHKQVKFAAEPPDEKPTVKRYISPLANVESSAGPAQTPQGSTSIQQTTPDSSASVFGGAAFGQSKPFGDQSSAGTISTAVLKPFGTTASPLDSLTKSNTTNVESGTSEGSNFRKTFGLPVEKSKEGFGGDQTTFGLSNQKTFMDESGKPASFAAPVFSGKPLANVVTTGAAFGFGSNQWGISSTVSKSVSPAFGVMASSSSSIARTTVVTQGTFVNTMIPVSFPPPVASTNSSSVKTSSFGEMKGKSPFGSALPRSLVAEESQKFGFGTAMSKSVFSSANTSENDGPSGDVSATTGVFGGVSASQMPKVTFGALSGKEPATKIKVKVSDGPSASSDTKRDFGFTVASSLKGAGKGTFGQGLSQAHKSSGEKSPEEKGFGVDISKNTSLVIREIPEVLNKGQWLRRFYSRFGEVVKVLSHPNKKSATVTFKTHEAAALAKRKGRQLKQGTPPVAIFWKQMRSNSRTLSVDSEMVKGEDASFQPRSDTATVSPKKVKDSIESSSKSRDSQQARIRKILQELDPSSFPSAATAGDKFGVMDSVDKKVRQSITKSSDLATAKATRGTCPDMCPEKERYMREDRRRLSIFEIIPGTDGSLEENPLVDHSRAVKEYSGSAADKLEPLPHELRPVSVLQMTMDYLVTTIMDASNDRWAEWFDFLWNRTRGIRKDITQQHLRDPGCVDLVEKTARFHVFCSHALCEQEMSAFDPKINNENLTKCLQTLKQFYDDLYKEKNIVCPSEAEFRAYDVLLNLNEGDTLRQIMQFRDEIQNSREVRFALDVFHALNSNNYAKFFKLVRSATYLNGCILHRYFTQVRSIALRTMNYSLSLPNRTTAFPIRDLVELLAFESEQEAVDYCLLYALDASDLAVQFSRTTFIEPEDKPPPKMAMQLIESKRMSSIGEVVYGSALPSPPNHLPTLSFDENGRYTGHLHILQNIGEDEHVEEETGKENQQPLIKDQQGAFTAAQASPLVSEFGSFKPTLPGRDSSSVMPSGLPVFGQSSLVSGQSLGFAVPLNLGSQIQVQQTQQVVPKPSPIYSNEVIKQIAKGLFVDVIDEMVAETSTSVMSKVQKYLALVETISQDFMDEVTNENIQRVAEITLQNEQQKWLVEVSKERSIQAIRSDIVEEMVIDMSLNLAQEMNREVKKQLVEQAKKYATQRISEELLEEDLHTSINSVAREAISEERQRRNEALKAIGEEVVRRRMLVLFKKWVKAYRARLHLKRLLREFPCMPPLCTDSELMERLLSENTELSAKQKAVLDGFIVLPLSDEEKHVKFNTALEKNKKDLEKIRNEIFRPLDVPVVLAESLEATKEMRRTAGDSTIFWKLLVSFPGPCNSPTRESVGVQGLPITPDLIREKLKRGVPPRKSDFPAALKHKIELLSLYKAEVRRHNSQILRFGVCTKACYGVLSNTEMHEVQETHQFYGTSAVLLVVTEDELQLKEAAWRLRRTIKSKPPMPSLPVVVMVLGQCSDDSILDDKIVRLGIQQLKEEDLVSDFKVITVNTILGVSYLEDKVREAVTWLGQNSAQNFGMTSTRLIDFIEEAVAMYFTTPLYEDLNIRRKAGLEQQCPEAVVDLYNGVLDHLASVMTSQQLCNMSWPVQEFNSKENGLPLVTWNSPMMLQNLADDKVLSLKLPPLPAAAEDGMWDSESKLCLQYISKLTTRPAFLLSRVERIIDGTRRSLEELDFLSPEPCLNAAQIPWPEILDACVHSLLTSLYEDPSYHQTLVYYFEVDWCKFVPPSLWRESVNESKIETFTVLQRKRVDAQNPKKSKNHYLQESFLESEENLAGLGDKIPQETQISNLNSQALISDVIDTRNNLIKELENSKIQSQRFDELLEKSQIEEEKNPLASIFSVRQKRKSDVLRAEKKARIHTGEDSMSDSPPSQHDVTIDSLERTLLSLQDSVRSQSGFHTRRRKTRQDRFLVRRAPRLMTKNSFGGNDNDSDLDAHADQVAELRLKSFLET